MCKNTKEILINNKKLIIKANNTIKYITPIQHSKFQRRIKAYAARTEGK